MYRYLILFFVVTGTLSCSHNEKKTVKTAPQLNIKPKKSRNNLLFPINLIKKMTQFVNALQINSSNNKKLNKIIKMELGKIPKECDFGGNEITDIRAIPVFSGNRALSQGVILSSKIEEKTKETYYKQCYISISKTGNKFNISSKNFPGFSFDLSSSKLSFKKISKDMFIIKIKTKMVVDYSNIEEAENKYDDDDKEEWGKTSYTIFILYKNGKMVILKSFSDEDNKEFSGNRQKRTYAFMWFKMNGDNYIRAISTIQERNSEFEGNPDYEMDIISCKIYRLDLKSLKLIKLTKKALAALRKYDTKKIIPSEKNMRKIIKPESDEKSGGGDEEYENENPENEERAKTK